MVERTNREQIDHNIQINSIYYKRAWTTQDRYVFLFGSAGSGKSLFALQKFIFDFFINRTNQKLFMSRKTARYIKSTVWAPVEAMLKDIGIWSHLIVNLTERTITDPTTGNQILMGGMDDPEKIKSIYGITKVFLEEATEFDEEDFLQIDLRMRGELAAGDTFQLWSSFNPTSDKHWLVKYVEPQYLPQIPENITDFQYLNQRKNAWRFGTVASDGNKIYTTVINSTYENNAFLDSIYKTRLLSIASLDENFYQIYALGRWGVIGAGDAYLPSYREAFHVVDDIEIDVTQPIHYTVDFNTKPYMSGLVCQLHYENEQWILNIIEEYTLAYPKNEAYHLGATLVENYEYQLQTVGGYLYGDASGNNKLGIKDTPSLFFDVAKGLDTCAYALERRIPKQNPRYKKIANGALGRRTFVNAIFNNKFPVKVCVSRSCLELIKDLRECRQDANGKLAKPKNKDGVEERGHLLQALEYLICYPDALGYLAKI
jgi:PBSX family phage terminase large subunit